MRENRIKKILLRFKLFLVTNEIAHVLMELLLKFDISRGGVRFTQTQQGNSNPNS